MRPVPGGDALPPAVKPRSRKSSVDHHAAALSSNIPTSFVMRRVEDLEHTMAPPHGTDTSGRQRDSTFGVQSLADTLEAAFGSEGSSAGKGKGPGKASKTKNHGAKSSRSGSSSSSAGSVTLPDGTPVRKLKRKFSNHGSPITFVPLNLDVPHPTSALSSTPRSASMISLKLSDEESAMEDAVSQAVASSGEEEEHAETQQGASGFPQLVMPSIQMPTRRPFTTRGKAMGKLKVMVAGETGAHIRTQSRRERHCADSIVQVSASRPSFDPSSKSAKTSSTSTLYLRPSHTCSHGRRSQSRAQRGQNRQAAHG
jgi:hypothetical protein